MARTDGIRAAARRRHLGVSRHGHAPVASPDHPRWALPLLIAHGYVLAFVFCIFHETAHRTAFRTRWLNTVVGTLAGLLSSGRTGNYRVYHWEHHRFTQDERGTPSLLREARVPRGRSLVHGVRRAPPPEMLGSRAAAPTGRG